MLIRHAEKAEPEDAETGVKKSGEDDKHSLSVEGWQRAGALVSLFAPLGRTLPEPRLARHASMIAEFADAPGSEEKKSKREEQTLLPLGKVLGFEPDFSFGKGQEEEAAGQGEGERRARPDRVGTPQDLRVGEGNLGRSAPPQQVAERSLRCGVRLPFGH